LDTRFKEVCEKVIVESKKPHTVYYFGTCLMDMFYPEAAMAGIKLIQREGVRVIFPRQQTCCGQPAYNSGFPKEAKKVALKQIDIFPENYPIVVPSGSCAGMMKHHYPLLFEGDARLDAIRKFSGRIVELSEFMVQTLDVQLEDRGAPIKVTWHSSCHALREMHIIEYSKSLIRQLQNVQLIELQNEFECCGFGGTFAVKQPDLSRAMVSDKIADIQQTAASRLLTGDCGCLMNINGAMEYQKIPIKGQHFAEFIWERINA
jgi:L-lactate dehydrogenase complex protein LldE